MKRLRLDTSGYLLIVMLSMVLVGIGLVLFNWRSDPVDETLVGDRIVSVLLVLEKDGAPLTIQIMSFYPPSRRAVVFDVPAELGLILNSLGRVDRIDAVYDSAKPDAFIKEVSSVLDLEIPFFMAFDLKALGDFVDLVEGLELFIAEGVDELSGDERILLPPGAVILDGDKVKMYAAYVLDDEDESAAVARRQRLAMAVFQKLSEENEYLSADGIVDVFQRLPRTNMEKRTFLKLLSAMAATDTERLTIQRVTGNYREVSGQRLLFPAYDGSLMRDIVKRSLTSLVRSGEGADSERVYTVEILNGTISNGMAKKTADLLEGFGYDTASVGNADRTDYADTVIIDHIGMQSAAQLLGEVIHCDVIQTEELQFDDTLGSDTGVDFTLIIGKDFDGRYVTK